MKKSILIPALIVSAFCFGQKFKIEENKIRPKITFVSKKMEFQRGWEMKLYVAQDKSFASTPVLSTTTGEGAQMSLVPNIDLAFGTTYKVVVNTGEKEYKKVFQTPQVIKVDGELSMEFVFPLAVKDTVPANNMLYYISFNTPMQQDQLAYKHIELIDDQGKVVDRPWRERTFWMNDGRMMTVMVHPAKLKRGIMERVGVAIHENKSYTIRIGDGVRDVYNRTVSGNREIKLHAVTRDTLMPRILEVDASPVAGAFTDVKIKFSEMMDYGSMMSYVQIQNELGEVVPVKVSYVDQSRQWVLRPKEAWKAGSYQLKFINALMDVAGNQLNRPFETPEPPYGQNEVFQRFTFLIK